MSFPVVKKKKQVDFREADLSVMSLEGIVPLCLFPQIQFPSSDTCECTAWVISAHICGCLSPKTRLSTRITDTAAGWSVCELYRLACKGNTQIVNFKSGVSTWSCSWLCGINWTFSRTSVSALFGLLLRLMTSLLQGLQCPPFWISIVKVEEICGFFKFFTFLSSFVVVVKTTWWQLKFLL